MNVNLTNAICVLCLIFPYCSRNCFKKQVLLIQQKYDFTDCTQVCTSQVTMIEYKLYLSI